MLFVELMGCVACWIIFLEIMYCVNMVPLNQVEMLISLANESDKVIYTPLL